MLPAISSLALGVLVQIPILEPLPYILFQILIRFEPELGRPSAYPINILLDHDVIH